MTPAAKLLRSDFEAISERSDKVTHDSWEPAAERSLDYSSKDGEREAQEEQVSNSWVQGLIGGDVIDAIVKTAAVPTWSKIPQRDQNAFASVLTPSLDKAMEATTERERLEGWYEFHFIFHLLFRQTPTVPIRI